MDEVTTPLKRGKATAILAAPFVLGGSAMVIVGITYTTREATDDVTFGYWPRSRGLRLTAKGFELDKRTTQWSDVEDFRCSMVAAGSPVGLGAGPSAVPAGWLRD